MKSKIKLFFRSTINLGSFYADSCINPFFVFSVMSWIPPIQNTKFYYLVTKFNYPFLEPIRRVLRRLMPGGFMIDFSPIILFALIVMVQRLLVIAL